MAEVHGGHLVAKALEREGVTHLFTLCGGHIDKILDALEESPIRVIDVRHEQAAAMMAQGWSIATGKLGVCLVTAGPGLTNAVTGVVDAMASHIPMLVISGRSPRKENDLGALQDIDQAALMRSITKAAFVVNDTHRIPEYIASAFRHATSDRPGPVYLEIPVDVLGHKVELDTVPFSPRRPDRLPARGRSAGGGPGGAAPGGRRAARYHRGWGCQVGGGRRRPEELVEKTSIPFILLNEGRGMVPDDHPLSLWDGGLIGLTVAAAQCDVALVAGLRMTWLTMYGKMLPTAKIIRVDIAGCEVGKNIPHEVGIVGDVGLVLSAIASQIGKSDHSAWAAQIRESSVALMTDENAKKVGDAPPIHPIRLVLDVYKVFGKEAVFATDGGDITYFSQMHLRAGGPGRFLSNGGNLMGCLGSGIPFGIAGKLAHPDRTSVVINR